MSPVRRRALRARKRIWLWIALAVLALALGGLWMILHRQAAVPPPTPKADPTVLLFSCEESALSSIHIAHAHDDYTLVRDEAGDWQMAGQAGFAFRPTMLDAILTNAGYVLAEDTIGSLSENGWRAADFGLETGIRVDVACAEGEGYSFLIGDAAPVEVPSYYMMPAEGDTVYLVAQDVYESFAYTRMALHEVPSLALQGDLVDRIAFTGADPFTLERRADGWYVTDPLVYPLSDTAMDALLDKVEALRLAQYVGETDADTGLDPAQRTLTLDIAPTLVSGYDENGELIGEQALEAYQLVFEVGSMESSTVFFCRYRGEVYRMTTFTSGFLRTQGYESLLSPAPFGTPASDLTRLTLEENGQRITYDLAYQERVLANNQLATDDSGHLIYDVAVRRNGEPADAEAFLSAYRSLLALRAADRLPGDYALPAEAPTRVYSLTYAASARTVALYPLDALHSAVAVDGVALFRVEKGWGADILWP